MIYVSNTSWKIMARFIQSNSSEFNKKLDDLTLMYLCFMISRHSFPVRAYLSLFLRKSWSGIDSRSWWGPEVHRVVYTPPNLSNIQDLGAAKRLRCFLGPRTMIVVCWKQIWRLRWNYTDCPTHKPSVWFARASLNESKVTISCCK